MKKTAILVSLVAWASISQATVFYSQDFSGSTPVDQSGAINPIVDDTYYASTGQNITGGSSAAQATNGDYTINLGVDNANAERGFVFNSTDDAITGQASNSNSANVTNTVPGSGFAAIDVGYTFTTGSITIDDQGTLRTGTVFINAGAFNVGGEFLSLNLLKVEENDATGEVNLVIDYNAFGDFGGGNETISLTTNFGVANDVTGLSIAPLTSSNDAAIEEVYTLQLVAASIPEPSSFALLGGLLALSSVAMKRRRA
ncbi:MULTISPECIES: PEP-CTERM sorting domain-containing protein [unclassified Lentimonas]|uniref:PEP-CTERM sorting domain-containing protein n=1 Tax=unclassified Lentimonas TaxID=2630993 RepID=UPI0013263D2F|nr:MULTISPECIES: PEP-CTERM sorting domain-containing protein [unclassified Lentimonas]CAA6677678.1 Unannotated [Lentimonas sp. CC4]CAA6684942.1 Unannotated [Lentimonas sp. CC6]CAA7077946.1 Unannotated [Lentimonas sp. CC4]CAA7169867.1 Unannotated [Lentimonas sp. CC21]CAA7181477.1 Unannotated [Lentimonas sp. CC8]